MTEDPGDIENLLLNYRPASPDTALRQRVVQSARVGSRWALVEAAAAILLVGLTFAQIGASVLRIPSSAASSEARTQQIAESIASLDLPVTPDEAYRMAQQLAAGEHLTPLPLIHGRTYTTIGEAIQ